METVVAAVDAPALAALAGLLNGAWKGALLAGGVALLLRLLPRGRVVSRHGAWAATVLLLVLLPLAEAWRAHQGTAVAVPRLAREQGIVAGGAEGPAGRWSVPAPPPGWSALLAGALAAVAALRVARLGGAARELRRLKRGASPLRAGAAERLLPLVRRHCGRAVELRESAALATPVALGYLRPVILLPCPLLDELGPDDAARVVLHELAHLRRRDDWVNLAQRLAEAVLFAQPALLWAGRRLELEREIACDEFVISVLADGRSYARCLVRLAKVAAAARPRPLAPGAAPAASQLARRVGFLLRPGRAERPGIARAVGVGVLTVSVGLAGTLHGAAGIELARPVVRPGAAGYTAGSPLLPDARPQARALHERAGIERAGDRQLAGRAGEGATPADHGFAVSARAAGSAGAPSAAGAERFVSAGEELPHLPRPEAGLACGAAGCVPFRLQDADLRLAAPRPPGPAAGLASAYAPPVQGRGSRLRVELTLSLPSGADGSQHGMGLRPVAPGPPDPRLYERAAPLGGLRVRVLGRGAGWRPGFRW